MPGSSMERVDNLSRYLDWQMGVKRNNKNRVLVKKEQLEIKAIQMAEVVIKRIDLLEKIRKSEAKDNKIIKAVKEIKQVEVKILRNKKQQEENSLMLREGKVYILRNKRLRAEVIQLYHDMPIEEHREQQKTTELVTRNFWWLKVMKKVKKYVKSCDIYQRNKNCIEILAEKLYHNLAKWLSYYFFSFSYYLIRKSTDM